MRNFKETHDVEFDDDDFAVHRICGARLTEEWSITQTESYQLKRHGSLHLVDGGDNDKECNGVWCPHCDARVTMRLV